MGQKVAADWAQVELEYKTTTATSKAIADKHGVTANAVRLRARWHGWVRPGQQQAKAGKAPEFARDPHTTPHERVSSHQPDSGESGRVEQPQGDSTDAGGTWIPAKPAVDGSVQDNDGDGSPETRGSDQSAGDSSKRGGGQGPIDPAHPLAVPLHRALVAVVSQHFEPGTDGFRQQKAVMEGAALQIEMIRQHRGDIRGARELALALMAQLEQTAGNRQAIEAAIYEFSEAGPKRAAMMRAVSLPSHISAMRDLSTTLRQLIPLERQALGIPDAQPLEPKDPVGEDGKVMERPALGDLEQAIEAQLAKITPSAERVG